MPKAHKLAYAPIDQESLGTRLYYVLRQYGLQYVGMLATYTLNELASLDGISKKGITTHVSPYLERQGLGLCPESTTDLNARIEELYGTTASFPLSYLAWSRGIAIHKLDFLETKGIKTLGDLAQMGQKTLQETRYNHSLLFDASEMDTIRKMLRLRGIQL